MRICMVISTPFPPEEGIGYYVYNLSKKLIEKGHEITVITRGSLRTEISYIDNIKIIKSPFIPLYPFHVDIHGYFVNRFFKSIENNFDVVHIHTPLSPIIKTSLPIIATIHTSVIEDARNIEILDFKSISIKLLTRFISYQLILKLIKSSKVITTVSNSVANELMKYYKLNNTIVIGNGVDEKIFTPIKEKNKKYILYVGRLSYRKGLFDLLECAKQICKNYDVKFILVGKGELESKIDRLIDNYGLKSRIIRLGHVDRKDLIELYQNAAIFLFPSHYEGLSSVILEAMACGLPVVTTDIRSNYDIIDSGRNGILVPIKSPEKMAIAISQLLDNNTMRIDMGLAARKTIEKKFTWDKISNNILNCYNSII